MAEQRTAGETEGTLTFGELLRRYRTAAGVSQDELAEQAGLSAHGISDLERGARQTPYPDTVQRLADSLHLDAPERAALLAARRSPHGRIPSRSVGGGQYSRNRLSVVPFPPRGDGRHTTDGRRRHNLPAALSSFIGRERDLAELQPLLGTARLLTLTGPGGVGKTRLALQLAAAVEPDYSDGVWLVELATLTDSALVARAVAAGLSIRERAHRMLRDTLAEAIASQRLLLVLDNCEHLIAPCAELVDALLRACPELRFLAASREALGVEGERTWPVPPLALPDVGASLTLEQLGEVAAIRLFAERAQLVRPDFALTQQSASAVVDVCRRLDGIPLALELAAARSAVLSPDELAVRLGNRFRLLVGGSRSAPPRQQTLRATLDWSYDLLDEPERRLFERLAVFVGGCTLAEAEAVCAGAGLAAEEVVDVLARLVGKSLVMADPLTGDGWRYRLPETLREYGQERLVLSGDAERMRDRHAMFYLELAEQVDPPGSTPKFRGPEARTWLDRLAAEHDNLRSALGWFVERGAAEPALRLAGALRAFWNQRGHPGEGRTWLTRVMGLPGSERTVVRAHALVAAGTLAHRQGDLTAATSLVDHAIALCREQGAQGELSFALHRRGEVATASGEYGTARALFADGLEVSRAVGQPALTALCLHGLGWVALEQGGFAEARAAAEEGLALATNERWPMGMALLQSLLGAVSSEEGDSAAARTLLEAGLALRRASGDRGQPLARNLVYLGRILLDEGDRATARALYGESVLLNREVGDQRGLAEALEGCACVAVAERRPVQALRLAGAAGYLRASIGAHLSPTGRRAIENWLGQARRSLGNRAADAAWAAGKRLTADQAVAEAMAVGNADTPPSPITSRERELVGLLTQGRTDRQIAHALVISERTAHAHVRNILAKLGLQNRVQIAAWAVHDGSPAEPADGPRSR